jgi:hypothetical protein
MTELEAQLAAQIEVLQKQVADLEARVPKPPKPFVPEPPRAPRDLTEGLSIPKEALRDLVAAVGDDVMRDIRGDARRDVSDFRPVGPDVRPTVRGSGWRDPAPLGPPPGIAQADRLMDAQDAKDRAELIAQEARRLGAAKG